MSQKVDEQDGDDGQDLLRVFEELCGVYRRIMVQSINAKMDHRLRQRQDASDIVQEAMLETFLRLAEFGKRQPMAMSTWLMESAIQQFRLAIRRHLLTAKRTLQQQVSCADTGIFEAAEQKMALQELPEDAACLVEESSRIEQALQRLPENDRQIIVLRNLNGLSNSEAANVLELTPLTASKRYSRALVRLRETLRTL